MKSTAVRSELDSMVVGIELTLVSIIQGVALNFLIEKTPGLLTLSQWTFWPYVISGLLTILIFWSRSVLHIITVIRWPIEFGHNFLYIVCAFVEAILFTQLLDPAYWFALSAVFAATGWVLFVYDLRLIRARTSDSTGEASNQLCVLVTRDQWQNIAILLPAVFLWNLAGAVAIHTWPDFFLARHAHVWIALTQMAGFGAYLFYAIRFFTALGPIIAAAHAEWREQEN